jgi:hypothetical protein
MKLETTISNYYQECLKLMEQIDAYIMLELAKIDADIIPGLEQIDAYISQQWTNTVDIIS